MLGPVSNTVLHRLAHTEIGLWVPDAQFWARQDKDVSSVQGCWTLERVQMELRQLVGGSLKKGMEMV